MMWDDNIKYQHINSYSVYYLPNVMPMMQISIRLWSIMNVIRRTTTDVKVMCIPDGHSFSSLAQINGWGQEGEIYYYFNDQLGTPQELVTAQVEIVWSAVYKSYGNLAIDYQTVPQPL